MKYEKEAYITELEKFKKICAHMQTHFDLSSRSKEVSKPKIEDPWKITDYFGVYINVCWDDDFLLPLYFALSQNCIIRDWSVIFWNIHNEVKPLEWLEEWNCYPALKMGSEKFVSEIKSKMYRESNFHKENSEKYIDHSPLFSCWWTVALSADKSWGLLTDLDANTHLFFNEKHSVTFNHHARRLKALGESEMIIFEASDFFLSVKHSK